MCLYITIPACIRNSLFQYSLQYFEASIVTASGGGGGVPDGTVGIVLIVM